MEDKPKEILNRRQRRAENRPLRDLAAHWFDNLAREMKGGVARGLLAEKKIPVYF